MGLFCIHTSGVYTLTNFDVIINIRLLYSNNKVKARLINNFLDYYNILILF